MIKFHPDNHIYRSIDSLDDTEWVSASKLSSKFKKKFDSVKTSEKVSIKKTSKWYGISPSEIRDIWQAENLRSTNLGTWYHEKEEQRLNGLTHIEYKGSELPIFRSIWEDGWKIAPDQKLVDGVYTELLAYVKSAGVCGQFDRVNVLNKVVEIEDFKSNKDLFKPPYKNWEGVIERMEPPLLHLENSKLVEYALQLSIGMYMILRHNPQFQPGKLMLNHVTFEVEGEDRFGYPIMRLENNEPILKNIEKVEVPYLKREVELIFEHVKQERLCTKKSSI